VNLIIHEAGALTDKIMTTLNFEWTLKIDLSGCENLTSGFLPKLAKKAVGLKYLNLRRISKMREVGKVIPYTSIVHKIIFPQLKVLDLTKSNVSVINLEAPRLKYLKAKKCSYLCSLSLTTPSLKKMDISYTPVPDKDLDDHLLIWTQFNTLIFEGCKMLSELKFRKRYPFYPASIFKESRLLKKQVILPLLEGKIESLDLCEDRIDRDDIRALERALINNTSLQKLDLSSNDVGSEGMGILRDALSKHPTLTQLNLAQNNLGNTGAEEVGKILESNTVLISLNLSSNKIGERGASALHEVLKKKKSLNTLRLDENPISEETAQLIQKSLSIL
jgi:hypothetical protein